MRSLLLLFLISSVGSPSISPSQQNDLRELVLQDCGSCHGLKLTGGLGSAITAEALQGKSATMLIETILNGRNNTPMPAWKSQLTRAEVAWIVEQLQKGNIK